MSEHGCLLQVILTICTKGLDNANSSVFRHHGEVNGTYLSELSLNSTNFSSFMHKGQTLCVVQLKSSLIASQQEGGGALIDHSLALVEVTPSNRAVLTEGFREEPCLISLKDIF